MLLIFPQKGFQELQILTLVIPCNSFLWKHTISKQASNYAVCQEYDMLILSI